MDPTMKSTSERYAKINIEQLAKEFVELTRNLPLNCFEPVQDEEEVRSEEEKKARRVKQFVDTIKRDVDFSFYRYQRKGIVDVCGYDDWFQNAMKILLGDLLRDYKPRPEYSVNKYVKWLLPKRLCNHYLKTSKQWESLEDTAEHLSTKVTPHDRYLQTERLNILHHCIESLSSKDLQKLFELHFLQEIPIRELHRTVFKDSGKSRSTLNRQSQKAYENVKDCVEESQGNTCTKERSV